MVMYMFIDDKNFEFEIVDVLKFKRKEIRYATLKRKIAVISCRLSGETNFYFDGKCVHASQNDYVIIPSNTEYEQKSSDEEVICLHILCKKPIVYEISSFHIISPMLTQLFRNIYEVWHEKKKGYQLKCKALALDILYEFASSVNSKEKSYTGILTNSVNYIYSHYREKDFSINKVIELSYVSPAYFRKLFKKQYNTTINSFVNNLRIEYAKSLLSGFEYSISEISEMSGFCGEKYFFTVFKNHTGMTPAKWRLI